MAATGKGRRVAGLVLHGLIAAMMLLSGGMKLAGAAPPPEPGQEMPPGLVKHIKLIGAGEVASALLLVVPVTSSLGLLLTSGFWGGAICFHLTRGDAYVLQSVLLLLTWAGAFLRDPATYASFTRRKAATEPIPSTPA